MANKSDLVRNKLIEINEKGLQLKSIALNAGLDANDLSHFKNGSGCLKESDLKLLSEYLNAVYIPQWGKVSATKKKATKLEMLQKLMKNSN